MYFRSERLRSETRTSLTRSIIGRERNQCKICNCQGNKKRIKVHVRQHYTRNFCSCGYNSVSRDTVLNHAKRCENSNRITYEVDKKSYPLFCNTMGWKRPPTFNSCRPKWSGRETVYEAKTSGAVVLPTNVTNRVECHEVSRTEAKILPQNLERMQTTLGAAIIRQQARRLQQQAEALLELARQMESGTLC